MNLLEKFNGRGAEYPPRLLPILLLSSDSGADRKTGLKPCDRRWIALQKGMVIIYEHERKRQELLPAQPGHSL